MCHTLILSLLLGSVFGFAFHKQYYYKQFENLNLSEELRVSQSDLESSIDVLLDYLHGKRDNIDVTIEKNGITKDAFHEEEYEHMIDVRDLSLSAQKVMYVSIAITVIIFIYSFIKLKKEVFLAIALRFRKAAIYWMMLFGILAIWIAADFSSFWVSFHKIFFRNELWLMNPYTDFMIQILPQPVFMGLVVRIVSCFAISFVTLFIASHIYVKKRMEGLEKER